MNNDLISREALIKALNEAQVEFDEYYKGLGKAKVITDNAPTVAVNCKDCDGYEAGYSAGLKDAERPQGEWITRTEDNGVNYRFYCSCCNREVLLITEFCPNCGAKMEGGAE